MLFLDDPIKERTTLVYKRSETNVEYTKIDRMFVLDEPIKQRTALVYTRAETNVEYAKIDRMFVQTIRLNREQP
jgi:EAL domain-containing protein (putative c-di-GMP-specific phosphodiesterase class I)